MEMFHIHGYARTTMESIAATAGVSPRTLYRHYGSKSALFVATISVGAADFPEQLAAYVQRWPLRRSILTAFANTAIDASDQSRALMHLVVTEDEVSQLWLSTAQRLLPRLANILRDATPGDSGDTVAWEARAGALIGALNVGYRRWATTPGSDLIGLVSEAVDAVLPILSPEAAGKHGAAPVKRAARSPAT